MVALLFVYLLIEDTVYLETLVSQGQVGQFSQRETRESEREGEEGSACEVCVCVREREVEIQVTFQLRNDTVYSKLIVMNVEE